MPRAIRAVVPVILLAALAAMTPAWAGFAAGQPGASPASSAGLGGPAAPADGAAAAPADSSRPASRFDQPTLDQRLLEADSLLKLRGGSHAENAQLYLAWSAPWGTRRARQVCMPACEDSSRADTLYLSFYPGRPSSGFNGVSAELFFHAVGQDTLGPWWHMETKGGENGGDVRVEWGPSEDMPGPQPWTRTGRGFVIYDRTPGALRLRLLYAVKLDDASPIGADTVYTLGRVILRHQRARGLAGCGQPVCVEWSKASLAFALKDEPEVRRGERFVAYGAPMTVCDPFRLPISRVWKPREWAKP